MPCAEEGGAVIDVSGFPLDQRTLDALLNKVGCTVYGLTIIHGAGLSKRAASLVRNNPGLIAVEDRLKRQDWWSAVAT